MSRRPVVFLRSAALSGRAVLCTLDAVSENVTARTGLDFRELAYVRFEAESVVDCAC
jgi:hypothetical protein